jgi:hypothetical protein
MHKYFSVQKFHPDKRLYHCMFADDASGANAAVLSSCSYNQTMEGRGIYANVWTYRTTITQKTAAESTFILPVTAPDVYDVLQRRKLFKVIYLQMGKSPDDLSPFFSETSHDSVFLSYKVKCNKCIFYPSSSYGDGRMALYLTGRLIEVVQGWLYDYFIFTDDDPVRTSGTLTQFELDLNKWRVIYFNLFVNIFTSGIRFII